MRSFDESFAAQLASRDKAPRFMIEVALVPASTPPTDHIYIASHGDISIGSIYSPNRWEFTSTLDSWAGTNATLTSGASAVTLDATASDPYITRTVSIAGGTYRWVRARVKRTAGSGWEGRVRYSTGGHGYSDSYYAAIATDYTQDVGEWATLEWDMYALAAGGTDWQSNTITGLKIDLGTGSADDYEIDWIEVTPDLTPLAARLESVGVISQRIYPDEGRSTIGAFNFQALDTNASLTTEQRTQLLDNDIGLRGKRVRFYVGFEGMDFADFQLYCTQTVQGVTYDAGVYTFQCQDVQREAKKRVFERVTLRLAQDIDSVTTTIPISGDTSLLEAFEHDAAFSDAPSSEVAYVRIDDEIIRVPVAGIDPNELTGVTRGALGTFAAAHTTQSGGLEDELTEVEEVIYLEMNSVKLAYAVLTGDLLGQTGKTLPSGWHAGITSDYIDEASFTGIGADLYNSGNAGVVLRFIDPDAGEAKRWVEQQIMRIIGTFLFVRTDGKLALRRLEEVLHGAAPIAAITDRELTDPPSLAYRYDLIANRLEIEWNRIDDETTRITRIDDATSITRWGASDTRKIPAYGLHGSRHSSDALRSFFQRYRSRYSGPPIVTKAETLLSMAALEVGDIVQVETATAVDHTDPETTVGLSRSFEIQGVTLDWLAQRLTFDLFGSTQQAAPIGSGNTGEAIPDSWFASGGTDIDSKAEVTGAAGVFTVNSNCSLTGHASLSNSAAIWRCDGDLVIPPGVTLTIADNVQLRVKGVLTINGTINGAGNGLAGVADTLDTSSWPMLPNSLFGMAIALAVTRPYSGVAVQTGNVGYYGAPRAGGGLFERTNSAFGSNALVQSFYPAATEGAVNVVPTYMIGWNGSVVTGLPDDLRGSSGGPGGKRHWNRSNGGAVQVNDGGTGGDGGAGLLVICRGATFGAAGQVNLSGADGLVGEYDAGNTQPAHAGAGAGGAPGAVIFVVDGVLNPLPVLTNTTIPAAYGDVPLPAGDYEIMSSAWQKFSEYSSLPSNRISYFAVSPTAGLLAGVAASRALYLSADDGAAEDPTPPGDPVEPANIMPAGWSDFESLEPDQVFWTFGDAPISDYAVSTARAWIGSRSIRCEPASGTDKQRTLMLTSITGGAGEIDNVILEPNRRYIVVLAVYLVNAAARADRTLVGLHYYTSSLQTIANSAEVDWSALATGEWSQVAYEIDARASSRASGVLRFLYRNSANVTTPQFHLDAVRLYDVTDTPWITAENFPAKWIPPSSIGALAAIRLEGGPRILVGDGSPESAATADPSSIQLDRANGKAYLKETGTGDTGWSELATTAGVATAIAAAAPQTKVAASDSANSSSTTLTDDAVLAGFDVLAATEYLLEAELRFTTLNDASDLKYSWQFSQTPQAAAGFVVDEGGTGVTDGTVSDVTLTSTSTRNSSGGSDYVLRVSARVLGHATLAATMDFQWARDNASGTTTRKTGSWMRLTPTN